MAQVNDVNIAADPTGLQMRTECNSIFEAFNTCHKGSSRPSSADEGTLWIDDSGGTSWLVKVYDGIDADITLGTINTSSNTFIPAGQTASLGAGVSNKTGNYTILNADAGYLVTFDATSGNKTASIAAVSGIATDWIVAVQKIDSSANTVTIDPNSTEQINGATTLVLSRQYDAAIIFKDGSGFKALVIRNLSGILPSVSAADEGEMFAVDASGNIVTTNSLSSASSRYELESGAGSYVLTIKHGGAASASVSTSYVRFGYATARGGTFVRTGYVGIASSSNADMYVVSDSGNVQLSSAGNVIANSLVQFNAGLKSETATGTTNNGDVNITGQFKINGSPVVAGVAQVVETISSSVDSTSSQIPTDGTVPTSSEGAAYVTRTITPTKTTSLLVIEYWAFGNIISATDPTSFVVSLFKDSDTSALSAMLVACPEVGVGGVGNPLRYFGYSRHSYRMTAGTTSTITFRLRFGRASSASGNEVYLNCASGTVDDPLGSNRFNSGLRVTEYVLS